VGSYTDGGGNGWSVDRSIPWKKLGATVGGRTFALAIPSPIPRMTRSTRPRGYGNFSYRFDVPSGAYDVTLHFAEVYWNAVVNESRRVQSKARWSRITMTFTLTSAMMSPWLCRFQHVVTMGSSPSISSR